MRSLFRLQLQTYETGSRVHYLSPNDNLNHGRSSIGPHSVVRTHSLDRHGVCCLRASSPLLHVSLRSRSTAFSDPPQILLE